MIPHLLTGDDLKRVGWRQCGNVFVYQLPSARLGWDKSTMKLYIGYGEWPHIIETKEEMRMILRALHQYNMADNL